MTKRFKPKNNVKWSCLDFVGGWGNFGGMDVEERIPESRPEVPVLETERLRLCPHEVGDFEALSAMWADPEVVRSIGGRPSSLADSWMRLIRYRGLWPVLGYGYWAIRERETGRFVGDLGFADFYREMEPSIRGIPEAGWVLARWAHGRGYASEALAGACAWLDRDGRHERSVCIVAPENAASIRVAEKCGFSERIAAEFKGAGCWRMTRRRAT